MMVLSLFHLACQALPTVSGIYLFPFHGQMNIISLENHVVRKALQLSLNEMALLCDIKKLSQNPKYNYWCVKSKDKMALWLDLSRATVFNAIDSLEQKGYVVRNDLGHIKPSQFIMDLDLAQEDIAIYIKTDDVEMITVKMKEIIAAQSKNYTDSLKIRLGTVQKLDSDSLKIRRQQSKNLTQDIKKKKIKENSKRETTIGGAEKNFESAEEEKTHSVEASGGENPPPPKPPAPPKSNFQKFRDWCDQEKVKLFWKLTSPLTEEEFERIWTEYHLNVERNREAFKKVVGEMENYKPLLSKYTSANLTLRSWLNRRKAEEQALFQPQTQYQLPDR